MSWAEARIQQYQRGNEANWVERRTLENANPVNRVFHILGAMPFIYGLWIHSGVLILAGILLNLIGHAYCWMKK